MNANDLWAGTDYAWSNYLQKGVRWVPPRYTKRVRVVRVLKRQEYGNKNATSYAEVIDIDPETEDWLNDGRTREVRARDIFMRWEEYADESDRREVEAKRLEKERQERWERERIEREQRLERERIEREAREAREARERAKLIAAIKLLGLPEPSSITDYTVSFDRRLLERRLLGVVTHEQSA
jgi:predicted ribosome quality control (RQC) complex YloA/Tae2 family protein